MKKCEHCGETYEESMQTCPYCSADVLPEEPPHRVRLTPLQWTAVAVAAGTVAAAAGSGIWYYNSDAMEVREYIDRKDYEAAQKHYLEQVRGDKTQEKMLDKLLQKSFRETAEQYKAGELKYSECAAQGKVMLSFGLPALSADIYECFGAEAESVYDQFMNKTMTLAEARRALQRLLNDGLVDDHDGTYTAMLAEMEALQTSRDAYDRGNTYLTHENYREALKNFRLVIESDANYDDARQKIARCEAAYRTEVLTAVQIPTTTAEYNEAVAALRAALEVLPEDAALLQRMQEVEATYESIVRQEVLNAAYSYADSLNFRAALDVLNRALAEHADDAELLAAMNTVKAAYSTYTKKLVANCLAIRDYNTACAYLREACALMPEDEALKALLADIELSAPTGLHELTAEQTNRFEQITDGAVADVFGNSYNGPNLFRMSAKSGDWDDADLGTVQYDLTRQGGFIRLMGTVVMAGDSSGSCGLQIYGDGQLIYDGPILSRTSAPVRVDVPLTGVSRIEIRMNMEEDTREAMSVLLLSGFQLYQ
ncbi:MAG: NPCBM/NEW2 domain-containing protein [Clostridia bacterium]|nr:NPCBM/NEW2 domain-containing protein [Clostridia bacterium]